MNHSLSPRAVLTPTVIGFFLAAGCGSTGAGNPGTADAPTDTNDLDGSFVPPDITGLLIDAPPIGDVDLGTAGTFAILAGSEITNTGFTVITGDVGISPGTAITGFPPGVVLDGTVHSADPIAAQAKLDLTTAYDNASNRSGSPIPMSGDLGGRTLTPGLDVSNTSMEISSGDLTLDAGGHPESVWVFQMGTTFTSLTGRQVILANGARGTNVFWQVGSSTTIGTYCEVAGNFLTAVSISIQTGASVDGRLLTQIGAVTLDTNTIIRTIPVIIY